MNIPYVMKKCNKCGEWLVASSINFHKHKSGKYGLKGQCKECFKEYYEENKDKINKRKKEYYEENKDKRLEYQKEYKEKNKDKIKEYQKEYNKEYKEKNKDKINKYQKEYYEENKDEINERHREHYEENKDEILERQRKYYERNKDEILERHREYYKKNKDKILEKEKEWRKDNPEKTFNSQNKRRSKLENQGRGITKEQWLEMMRFFDWKCAYSEEKLKDSNNTYGRTVDHIVALDNGGLNEPWNIIPMRKGYNCSKRHRYDTLNWYMEQGYFDIDRLNKIVEWQIYAYEKWGGEEFGELILITDLLEEVKNYE